MEDHFALQGHLTVTEDIFGFHNGSRGGEESATGTQWVQARETAVHSTKHREVSHNKELSSQICQSAEVAKAGVKESLSTLDAHNRNHNDHQAQSPSKF